VARPFFQTDLKDHAMTPTPESLAAEMDRLQLTRFDFDTAWAIGSHLRALAVGRGLPVGIEVTHGATPVFLTLLPGSSPDNTHWLRRKRNTALRFHRPSLSLRLSCEAKGVDFHARYGLDPADYAASGGSVPMVVRGVGVVGAATVSGLPDVEDHALVVAALDALGLV
jgi:uncharacterized protein (UPF0303 family)